MYSAPAAASFCSTERERVPSAVRRRELFELAGLTASALGIQALLAFFASGPSSTWASIALHLALPAGAALTLRRSVGRPAFIAAAILGAGLVAGMLVAAPAGTRELTTNAYVAAAMVWVLGSNPRNSTAAMIAGATTVALALVASALI